jgi:hypothetical protein
LSLRLTNEGEGTADFGIQVLVNGVLTLERRVVLTSGATRFTLPVVDNVGWRIRVTEASGDGLVEEFTGESTCREAWAEIDLDCGAGAALVRLGVEGELGARLVVLVDDVVAGGPVRLGAGTSTHRPVVLDHGTELISVYDDSRTDPLAVVDVDCALGGGSDDGLRHVAVLVAALLAISVVAVVWKGGIITPAAAR